MPKSSNQKLKLIYLMKILLERTDETHGITMSEIIDALAAYDISAERKSLYSDIENLRLYGLDIIGTQEDRTYFYHIGNRRFLAWIIGLGEEVTIAGPDSVVEMMHTEIDRLVRQYSN